MNKQDLKTGMIVELNSGEPYMVIKGDIETKDRTIKDILFGKRGWIDLDFLAWENVSKVYVCVINGTYGLFDHLKYAECVYEREKVNWEGVTVDTKLMIYRRDGSVYCRYFSHYDSTHDTVYFFPNGSTSFSYDPADALDSVQSEHVEVFE